MNITDGAAHQIALYSMDWDSRGRVQTIQVIDDASGAVLYDSGPLTNFTKGLYYKWSVTGHVKVKVINTGTNGTNAVINGAFFN